MSCGIEAGFRTHLSPVGLCLVGGRFTGPRWAGEGASCRISLVSGFEEALFARCYPTLRLRSHRCCLAITARAALLPLTPLAMPVAPCFVTMRGREKRKKAPMFASILSFRCVGPNPYPWFRETTPDSCRHPPISSLSDVVNLPKSTYHVLCPAGPSSRPGVDGAITSRPPFFGYPMPSSRLRSRIHRKPPSPFSFSKDTVLMLYYHAPDGGFLCRLYFESPITPNKSESRATECYLQRKSSRFSGRDGASRHLASLPSVRPSVREDDNMWLVKQIVGPLPSAAPIRLLATAPSKVLFAMSVVLEYAGARAAW